MKFVLGCIDASDNKIWRIFHIFRDLQDFYTFAPLRTQNFKKIQHFWQNLVNFLKFCKFCWNFAKKSAKFVEFFFCVQSGAKVWKSCRSRKIWKNAPFLAIVAVDTAENELRTEWCWGATGRDLQGRDRRRSRCRRAQPQRPHAPSYTHSSKPQKPRTPTTKNTNILLQSSWVQFVQLYAFQ